MMPARGLCMVHGIFLFFADISLLENLILDFKKGRWFEKLYGKFVKIYKSNADGMKQAIVSKYNLHLPRHSCVEHNLPHSTPIANSGGKYIFLMVSEILPCVEVLKVFVNNLVIGDILSQIIVVPSELFIYLFIYLFI